MFGEPENVPGECNAHLYIADNYGDNHATMRCQLSEDHEGLHKETFQCQGTDVTVTWEIDEKGLEEDDYEEYEE
jgi:hypothetical protein